MRVVRRSRELKKTAEELENGIASLRHELLEKKSSQKSEGPLKKQESPADTDSEFSQQNLPEKEREPLEQKPAGTKVSQNTYEATKPMPEPDSPGGVWC